MESRRVSTLLVLESTSPDISPLARLAMGVVACNTNREFLHETKMLVVCFIRFNGVSDLHWDLSSLALVIVLPATLIHAGSCPLLSWF